MAKYFATLVTASGNFSGLADTVDEAVAACKATAAALTGEFDVNVYDVTGHKTLWFNERGAWPSTDTGGAGDFLPIHDITTITL